jgi:hypothetical protein
MGNAQTEKKKRQRKNKRYREWLKRRLAEKTDCPEGDCDGDCENCLAAGDDSLYEAGDH